MSWLSFLDPPNQRVFTTQTTQCDLFEHWFFDPKISEESKVNECFPKPNLPSIFQLTDNCGKISGVIHTCQTLEVVWHTLFLHHQNALHVQGEWKPPPLCITCNLTGFLSSHSAQVDLGGFEFKMIMISRFPRWVGSALGGWCVMQWSICLIWNQVSAPFLQSPLPKLNLRNQLHLIAGSLKMMGMEMGGCT